MLHTPLVTALQGAAHEMTWLRVDDSSHDHPKVSMAGNEAWGCWTRMSAWSGFYLTDGFVPSSVALAKTEGRPEILNRLIDAKLRPEGAGLLEAVYGGFMIHDFLDYNPSREQVEREREMTHNRVKRHRKGGNAVSNGVTTTVSNGVPDPDPLERDLEKEENRMKPIATLVDLEQLGYGKYGTLGGPNVPRLRKLLPIFSWELAATLKTQGRSWAYAAKVLEGIREEQARPTPPAGREKKGKVRKTGWLDRQPKREEAFADSEGGKRAAELVAVLAGSKAIPDE